MHQQKQEPSRTISNIAAGLLLLISLPLARADTNEPVYLFFTSKPLFIYILLGVAALFLLISVALAVYVCTTRTRRPQAKAPQKLPASANTNANANAMSSKAQLVKHQQSMMDSQQLLNRPVPLKSYAALTSPLANSDLSTNNLNSNLNNHTTNNHTTNNKYSNNDDIPTALADTMMSSVSGGKRQRLQTMSIIKTNTELEGGLTIYDDGATQYRPDGETVCETELPLAVPAYAILKIGQDFELVKKVARGGFSDVFVARLLRPDLIQKNQSQSEVIVKQLYNISSLTPEENQNTFYQEVAIMSDLSLKTNFVKFLGYTEEPSKMILMRYYQCGSLYDLIFMKGNLKIQKNEWKISLIGSLMADVATALVEIHTRGIYHQDLKPDNVFVEKNPDGSLVAVLADFSMSFVANGSKLGVKAFHKSLFKGLSVAYAPPELLRQFQNPTDPAVARHLETCPPSSCDVFAFGVTVFELLTRTDAWPMSMNETQLMSKVLGGERPPWPAYLQKLKEESRTVQTFMIVAERCWAQLAADRPQMVDMQVEIESARKRLDKKK